jgi:hypothetical protein
MKFALATYKEVLRRENVVAVAVNSTIPSIPVDKQASKTNLVHAKALPFVAKHALPLIITSVAADLMSRVSAKALATVELCAVICIGQDYPALSSEKIKKQLDGIQKGT